MMQSNNVHVDLQIMIPNTPIPAQSCFHNWVKAAINGHKKKAEVCIRVVDEKESAQLNKQWRQKNYPTNVLSFSADFAPNIPVILLGDLVICASIINKEAKEQNKSTKAHWAHIVIHGILHLLGYDHIKEEDAECMEALEIKILKEFNFNNPYL